MLPTIANECSEFLENSHGFPLLKNLPRNQYGFRKVKVRKKKKLNDEFVKVFNNTFSEYKDLINRSIFAHGMNGFDPIIDDGLEPFFIFPINGYKYIFSKNVTDTDEHKSTLNKLVNNYGQNGINLFQEILKYQYSFDNLLEGISSNSEIIIYNIPFYYAIRYSLIEDYEKFLS